MKLRIQGNSLRLRVSRSDLSQLMNSARVDATIYFGTASDTRLTYSLVHRTDVAAATIEHGANEVTVVLPSSEAQAWAESEQVGVYGSCEIGRPESLELIVEKDFACLDQSDAENADTFPNPTLGVTC